MARHHRTITTQIAETIFELPIFPLIDAHKDLLNFFYGTCLKMSSCVRRKCKSHLRRSLFSLIPLILVLSLSVFPDGSLAFVTPTSAKKCQPSIVHTNPFHGASVNGKDADTSIEGSSMAGQKMDWKKIGAQTKEFWEMAFPYYEESIAGRWLFAGMIGLTLLNSGVSVAFSYLGKDFWNALSSKDTVEFYNVLSKYVGALLVGGRCFSCWLKRIKILL